MSETADVVVVGAGAAGLAAGIFAKRAAPHARVVCLDGARRVGAKILVSGGSRCNVTNRVVSERDFWGGSPRAVRRVLRAFPADRAAAFFTALGVALHEEEDGKLFPDSGSARSVLDALLGDAARVGVTIAAGTRVVAVEPRGGGFDVAAAEGRRLHARIVVLATGGRSLPKSGSDGFGYELAARLGHGYVETTPALAPLVLDGGAGGLAAQHAALSGVTLHAGAALWVDGRVRIRLDGPLLWTHFGVSGPLALNVSRHWHRAALERRQIAVTLSVLPGARFEAVDAWWLARARERPRAQAATVLGARLPSALAVACLSAAGLAPEITMAHVDRDARRRLLRVLLESPLPIRDSRGYAYAEVTAGGVPLDEIDPATMASRVCPGVYLVGEMLDVDGRLGGFNFQWAWSSGWVAGQAIGRALGAAPAGTP